MKIRRATSQDASALAELSRQLGYPTSFQQAADRLRVILASNDHVVFIADKDDGSVIGWVHAFISLRVESDTFAELGGFIVDGGYRGCGIGRSLITAAENWAIDLGISKLRVRSRSNRPEAPGFYSRLGFSIKKEQLVFEKHLKKSA
jgi:predicted N-acetyltransferase YhbS